MAKRGFSSGPEFRPKPGQVDFTKARWAPVINCAVRYRGKILVVRRSPDLNFYPGYWNGISGFLDDHRSLERKVRDELREELGLSAKYVRRVRLGTVFDQEAPRYGKTWVVHPVLVDVSTDRIRLDWEAHSYRWATLKEARKLKLLPGFDKVLYNLSIWID